MNEQKVHWCWHRLYKQPSQTSVSGCFFSWYSIRVVPFLWTFLTHNPASTFPKPQQAWMTSFKRKKLLVYSSRSCILASVGTGSAQECLRVVANIWPAQSFERVTLKEGKNKWSFYLFLSTAGGGGKNVSSLCCEYICTCMCLGDSLSRVSVKGERRVHSDCSLVSTYFHVFSLCK